MVLVLEPALAGGPGLSHHHAPPGEGDLGKIPTHTQTEALCSVFVSVQLEEQLSRLQREKNEIQNRLEEDQEDMNELMKKHKAAVAQVPCPGMPTTPCAQTLTSSKVQRSSIFGAVPGTQSRVEWGTFEGYGGSCFSTHSFPRPPGTWLR